MPPSTLQLATMGSLSYVPIVLLCAGLAAYIAHTKYRRPIVWFFIGLLSGPIAVVIILLLGDR